VSQNSRVCEKRLAAAKRVIVGAADADPANANQRLARAWTGGFRDVDRFKVPRLFQANRFHCPCSLTTSTGRQGEPLWPLRFTGSAQNVTGCGRRKTPSGKCNSSTIQMLDDRRISCVRALSGSREPPME